MSGVQGKVDTGGLELTEISSRFEEVNKWVGDSIKGFNNERMETKEQVGQVKRKAVEWEKELSTQLKCLKTNVMSTVDAVISQKTPSKPKQQQKQQQQQQHQQKPHQKERDTAPLEALGKKVHVPGRAQRKSPSGAAPSPTSIPPGAGQGMEPTSKTYPGKSEKMSADHATSSLKGNTGVNRDTQDVSPDQLSKDREKELDECHATINKKEQKLNELTQKQQELELRIEEISAERDAKERDFKQLMGEKKEVDTQVDELKLDNKSIRERNTVLEIELDEKTTQLGIMETDLNHLRGTTTQLQKDKTELEKGKKELEKELGYWKNKFGQLASDKVQSDPDVADLGDAHRALKIAEKYNGMYDGIWFKALRVQKKEGRKERDAVINLRTILKEAFTYCEQLAMQQETTLNNVFLCPVQTKMDGNQARNLTDKRLEIHLQKMKEVRKALSVGAVEDVKQAFWEDCKQKITEMTDVDKKCMDKSKEYYLKCIEICWPMALHNPPLYMKMDVKQGEPVDLDLYTCRSSGDFVDILAWPPLYQGEHGGLLAKGVVEGLKMVKKTGTAV